MAASSNQSFRSVLKYGRPHSATLMFDSRPLASKDVLTLQLRNRGVYQWNTFLNYVRDLPYGRNQNRHDLSLVLEEAKGSCSSKHALIRKIAQHNAIPGVQLFFGIYAMNEFNTPGTAPLISRSPLDYIPEAHCYIRIRGKAYDLTHSQSDFDTIQPYLLTEEEIEPEQVADFKVQYHQAYLERWRTEKSVDLSQKQIWTLRERCIRRLERTA